MENIRDRAARYWACAAAQEQEELRDYFTADAVICWHCTDEEFSVEEYVRANCEYPGDWTGEVERAYEAGDLIVTAAQVKSEELSCHVCSFFEMDGGKIKRLDEYWGDDGPAPEWRRRMKIGKSIETN